MLFRSLQTGVLPDNKNPLKKIEVTSSIVNVPDISRAILIPVTRAAMVEKKQTLTLKKGMLLENAIIKPSEAEAILAIPVNILKAVFSIPGQLLSFRINHIQQQKNLVTEDAALSKAILDSEKAKLGTTAELAKAKLEAEKNILTEQTNVLKAWQGLLEEMKKKLPGNA